MSLPSVFGLLWISQRSMSASQLGVQISNHNIANINTPGYVRQELMLTPSRSISTAVGEIGMGVQLSDIRRITDEFLQSAFYTETSEYNEWKETANILDQVEVLSGINENSSLAMAINEFFGAFGDLAINVEDSSVRTIVVNAAATMTERFNAYAAGLDRLDDQVNTTIHRQSREVTDILREIAELNGMVVSSDVGEAKSNDLRVRREQLTTRLAELVKFTASEDKYGALDVYIAGRNVLHRDSYVDVTTVEEGPAGDTKINIHIDGFYLAADRVGGSLGSLAETRDKELASIRNALDTLAETIATKVNDLHTQGYSPAGNNVPFFEGADARGLEVNSLLKRHPEYVAHSYNNTAGDNGLANDMAALGAVAMQELGGRSIQDYYSHLVGEVGSLSSTAKGMMEGKEKTMSQVLTRIESISGVSLDEEIANVTRYQTMYEASARMINTVNEMLDTVLTLGNRY